MCWVGLVGVAELQSPAARRLPRRSRLDESAGKVVGLMPGMQAGSPVGSMAVATSSTLMGLPLG
jgi:hypothetical protein